MNHLNNSRLWKAFLYSLAGLKAAWKAEAAFRQEFFLALILLPLALLSDKTAAQKAMLISSVLLLIIIELLNSAVECAIDRFGEERHELSKRAKDIASAAVFVALLNMIAVWACLFLL
jgi:diacylglycerol kinase (ATP)